MTLVDTNELIFDYLSTAGDTTNALLALVTNGATIQIYSPRMPEGVDLSVAPAVTYFVRGGFSDPNVPVIISPSYQFDCWASTPIVARQVYRALYDAMGGLVSVPIIIGGTTYYIMKSREEVHGVDLVDEIPGYFRVMSFYSVTVKEY